MIIHDIHMSSLMHEGFTGVWQGGWIHTNLTILLSQHPIVRVDCANIELDAAVWKSSIAVLSARRGHVRDAKFGALVLKGLTMNSRENLWIALWAEFGLNSEIRNCCVLIEEDNGLLYLFGKMEQTVKETFNDLLACGELTASHLASMDGISLSAASTRLKTLRDLGLCQREKRSEGSAHYYVYSFIGEGVKS